MSVANAHPFILSLLVQGTKDNMDTIGSVRKQTLTEVVACIKMEVNMIVIKKKVHHSDTFCVNVSCAIERRLQLIGAFHT